MTKSLEGKAVVVLGGSSGIGREVARSAARLGARLAVVARREVETRALADEVGGVAIVADLRKAEDCDRIAVDAVDALGRIDVLIVTAAISPVQLLVDSDAGVWRSVFETNVIGPMLVARRLVKHMAPHAMMVFVSSDSVGAPYHGMAPYSASKAALEEAVRGLRCEHPDIRVVCAVVGPTLGTDISRDLDAAVVAQLYPVWVQTGRLTGAAMEAAAVADSLVGSLGAAYAHTGLAIDHIVIRPSTHSAPNDVQEILGQLSSAAVPE